MAMNYIMSPMLPECKINGIPVGSLRCTQSAGGSIDVTCDEVDVALKSEGKLRPDPRNSEAYRTVKSQNARLEKALNFMTLEINRLIKTSEARGKMTTEDLEAIVNKHKIKR